MQRFRLEREGDCSCTVCIRHPSAAKQHRNNSRESFSRSTNQKGRTAERARGGMCMDWWWLLGRPMEGVMCDRSMAVPAEAAAVWAREPSYSKTCTVICLIGWFVTLRQQECKARKKYVRSSSKSIHRVHLCAPLWLCVCVCTVCPKSPERGGAGRVISPLLACSSPVAHARRGCSGSCLA